MLGYRNLLALSLRYIQLGAAMVGFLFGLLAVESAA